MISINDIVVVSPRGRTQETHTATCPAGRRIKERRTLRYAWHSLVHYSTWHSCLDRSERPRILQEWEDLKVAAAALQEAERAVTVSEAAHVASRVTPVLAALGVEAHVRTGQEVGTMDVSLYKSGAFFQRVRAKRRGAHLRVTVIYTDYGLMEPATMREVIRMVDLLERISLA